MTIDDLAVTTANPLEHYVQVPGWWGGFDPNGAHQRFVDAVCALSQLAKAGDGDSVLLLIVRDLEDAVSTMTNEAFEYGRDLGPGLEPGIDFLGDEDRRIRCNMR